MTTIHLDRYANPISITDEAYETIIQIIEGGRICEQCRSPYGKSNPMVCLNLCLTCFLPKNKALTYLGKGETVGYGGSEHLFIDPDGQVWTTHEKYEKCERNVSATLRYWGFPRPTSQTTAKGNEITLHACGWDIVGDVHENAVIISFHEAYYDGNIDVSFLVDKQGNITELNKRKGAIRKLFASARTKAEQSKDVRGYYHHPNGHESSWLGDYHLHQWIVAELAATQVSANLKAA